MHTFTKLTFLIHIINAIALKIYESNVAREGEKIITGLHYKRGENENPILTNSITTCVRLNLKRLGSVNRPEFSNNPAPLIIIPSSEKNWFLYILAGYPESWIILENYNYGNNFYIFKVLLDPVSDSYLIWKLYTWHHICFSYSEQNSTIRFVKVISTAHLSTGTPPSTKFMGLMMCLSSSRNI